MVGIVYNGPGSANKRNSQTSRRHRSSRDNVDFCLDGRREEMKWTPGSDRALDREREIERLKREQQPTSPFLFTSGRGASLTAAGFARTAAGFARMVELRYSLLSQHTRKSPGFRPGLRPLRGTELN